MKKKIVTLVLLLVITVGYSSTFNCKKGNVLELAPNLELLDYSFENESLINTSPLQVVVAISTNNKVEKCVLEGKLTIKTEEGDSILIEFKVSADTCKEAIRVQNLLLGAFKAK